MKVQTGNSGNPNTEVDLRGAVGLLSRSITIRSLGSTADASFPAALACGSDVPDCYFGGHSVARQVSPNFNCRASNSTSWARAGAWATTPFTSTWPKRPTRIRFQPI
jgi:hypothetical protein